MSCRDVWTRLGALPLLGALLAAACASAPTGTDPGSPPNLRPASRAEMQRALNWEYRASGLMEQGVEGTTNVWMFVSEEGLVDEARVHTSSGNLTLDQAAMRVARAHRFEPARRSGKPVAVWVRLSFTFSCDSKPTPETIVVPRPVGPVRGETTVALLVGADGRVSRARIATSSGSPGFDRAVLEAVRNSRYQPGTIDCKPAEMWTTMKFGSGR